MVCLGGEGVTEALLFCRLAGLHLPASSATNRVSTQLPSNRMFIQYCQTSCLAQYDVHSVGDVPVAKYMYHSSIHVHVYVVHY